MQDGKISVLGIGDSPKLTTGFATVTKNIYPTLAEEFDFLSFGWMDHDPDVDGKLGYKFYPSQIFDPLGTQGSGLNLIRAQNPDVVWIIADPGNIATYVHNIIHIENAPKIVAYVPIEGWPINQNYIDTFNLIQENGGKVVVYSETSKSMVLGFQDDLDLEVVYHGADHGGFYPYTPETKETIKKYVGFEDCFVVGSIGVNKRTKGFDSIIYTAAMLNELYSNHNILFYIHTDPDYPTMGGYPLRQLAKIYGVEKTVLFKPDANQAMRGNINLGVTINEKTLEWLKLQDVPETPEDRVEMFTKYDFLTRFNLFDLYLDLSQVEGWGLPQTEAWSCGVPLATVNDLSIRNEVHLKAAYELPTLSPNLWSTWHTGSRLVAVDPVQIAEHLYELKDNAELLNDLVSRGFKEAKKYTWDKAANRFVDIIKEVYEEGQEEKTDE